MKFKAPGQEPVMIGLVSGHTMVVDTKGTEVPQRFRREAIARGCIPVGMGVENAEVVMTEEETRQKRIKDAIEKMLDGGDDGDFTADGKPDLKKLSDIVGHKVTREERDVAWTEVEKTLKGESDDSKGAKKDE